MNSLTIKGKSNDVKEMFGLQRNDNLEDFLHNNYVSLRTWFPMPQTFCDVDTVNSKCKRDDKNLETQMPLFNSDEEYEEYSRKYDEAVEYQRSTYGVVGWYYYNIITLGTKWDSCLNERNDFQGDTFSYSELDDVISVNFHFDTAWAAPLPWYNQMVEKFSNISFSMECEEEFGLFHFLIEYDAETRNIRTTELELPDWDDESVYDNYSE